MKKKSTAGVFFTAFLKAIVVILGLVIVVMAVFLVRNVIENGRGSKSGQENASVLDDTQTDALLTASENSTEAETAAGETTEEAAEETDYSASIVLLNGTSVAGLAGAWQTKLMDAGYTNVAIGNYLPLLAGSDTQIYTANPGTGKALQQLFSSAQLTEGTDAVKTEDTLSTDGQNMNLTGMQYIIIIGNADNILAGAQ